MVKGNKYSKFVSLCLLNVFRFRRTREAARKNQLLIGYILVRVFRN